jgi:hypothetical protein
LFALSSFIYADDEIDDLVSENLNIGGAFVTWKYDESGQTYSPISFEAIIDYKLFEPLEVSLRLGVGFGEDENEVGSSTQSASMDYYKVLYLKPYVDWKDMRLYGLLGYANYDFDANPNVGASGVSYGLGSDYNLFEVATVFIEWRRFPEGGGNDLSSIAMGFILPY